MPQNLLSSGVSPDYLQALSAAYNQYFPQQQAYNPAMLQQWYGQQPQQAPALPQNAAPSSVVGSLFGNQYPQTTSVIGGEGSDASRAIAGAWGRATPEERAAFYGNNPTMAAITRAGLGMFGGTFLGQLQNKIDPNIQPLSMAQTYGTQGLADFYGSRGLAGYGGGYGIPGATTSATGANIAANPMSIDPQQAQAAMQAAAQAQMDAGSYGFGYGGDGLAGFGSSSNEGVGLSPRGSD